MITDDNGNRRFYGTYRGVVVDNRDPLGKSRLRLQIPQVLFDATTDWAWSQDTYGVAGTVPPIGQGVWVMFEGGDPSFPVWTGTFGPAETKSGTSLEQLSDVAVGTLSPGDLLHYDSTVSMWVNASVPSLNLVRTTDTGTVTGAMIANATITGADIASNTVTSANILDATIVNADISATAAIAVSKLAASSVTINGSAVTLGNAVTVTATPTALSVTTGTIADGNVTNVKLATSSLTVNGVAISLGGSGTVTATPTAGSVVAASIVAGGLPTTSITNFDTTIKAYRLDQFTAPTASIPMNAQTFTNLATPVNANDAATKAYADSISQGLDIKSSVRVATTANITLSGTQTIDGIAVVAGDRVLVKNQTNAFDNGIYVCASGAWVRASDASTSAMVTSGMYTFVSVGTSNAATGFVLTTPDPITLGTTNLTYVQFSGAGQIVAGSAMSKSGNTLSVVGTAGRISVAGAGVDIDSTYVGQTSITTLGTVTTGTWSGTTVAVNKGGTGATTLTGYVKGNGTSAMTAVTTIPATDVTGLGAVSMPTGAITMWAGATAPTGWLLCDGSAVSRTTQSALFTAISTTYGVGDGSTTFNVPNFKGRAPVGYDSTQTEFNTLGETGGEKTHQLTVAEMPSHNHGGVTSANVAYNTSNVYSSGGSTNLFAIAWGGTLIGADATYQARTNHSHSVSSQGGDGAHNNLQPYLALNFIIKT